MRVEQFFVVSTTNGDDGGCRTHDVQVAECAGNVGIQLLWDSETAIFTCSEVQRLLLQVHQAIIVTRFDETYKRFFVLVDFWTVVAAHAAFLLQRFVDLVFQCLQAFYFVGQLFSFAFEFGFDRFDFFVVAVFHFAPFLIKGFGDLCQVFLIKCHGGLLRFSGF